MTDFAALTPIFKKVFFPITQKGVVTVQQGVVTLIGKNDEPITSAPARDVEVKLTPGWAMMGGVFVKVNGTSYYLSMRPWTSNIVKAVGVVAGQASGTELISAIEQARADS